MPKFVQNTMRNFMTYKVYGFYGSRSLRVTWLLEELGQDYEFIHTRPHSKKALDLNPSGKIPILVDNGTPITDSAAICLYLSDKHFDKGLSAKCGTVERAKLDSWLHFAQSEFEAPLWTIRKHQMILPKELRANVAPAAIYEFDNAMKALKQRMGDAPYAMGDHFSIADIFLTQIGQWARHTRMKIDNNFKQYLIRNWERPALVRARTKEEQAEE